VYAYAREDLDDWQTKFGRTLNNGNFGENLTTSGIDVTGARIGERWHVGSDGLVLEVTSPRTPCRTFAAFLEIPDLIKTFTKAAIPGAYLRVISPGTVRAGDQVVVSDRPDHDVTVAVVFRAILSEPELLPQLIEVDALPAASCAEQVTVVWPRAKDVPDAGAQVTVMIPVVFINHERSPGLRRGGILNIVRHGIEMICSVDNIPERVVVDLDGLDIGDSVHSGAVQMPEGARPVIHERDFTVASIAASSAVREEAAAAAVAAATAPPEAEEGEQPAPAAATPTTPGAPTPSS